MDTKKFWESENQKKVRTDLIESIQVGDALLDDEDYKIEFNWSEKDKNLAESDEFEF